MAYADYTFYTADFHGNKISETDYPYFAERASEYLDNLSLPRPTRSALPKPAVLVQRSCTPHSRINR